MSYSKSVFISIHVPPAIPSSAVADNLVLFIRKLVVVRQFLPGTNVPFCIYYNFLLAMMLQNFSVTIWVTAVVDEASH